MYLIIYSKLTRFNYKNASNYASLYAKHKKNDCKTSCNPFVFMIYSMYNHTHEHP